MDKPWDKFTRLRRRQQRLWTVRPSETLGLPFWAGGSGSGTNASKAWMDRWNELAGFARIEPIESPATVSRYVSKYVVKGGEIDMGGPLVPAVLPLFEAAFRPGSHEAGSAAGSVKAAQHPEGARP